MAEHAGSFETWLKEQGFNDSSIRKIIEEAFMEPSQLADLNESDILSLKFDLAQQNLLKKVVATLQQEEKKNDLGKAVAGTFNAVGHGVPEPRAQEQDKNIVNHIGMAGNAETQNNEVCGFEDGTVNVKGDKDMALNAVGMRDKAKAKNATVIGAQNAKINVGEGKGNVEINQVGMEDDAVADGGFVAGAVGGSINVTKKDGAVINCIGMQGNAKATGTKVVGAKNVDINIG